MAEKLLKYDVAMKSTKTVWQMDIPRANTGDENTVTFAFNITDLDSAELTGATPNVNLYMRDGSFFQCRPEEGVELNGQRVTYTMRENEGKHNGKAKAELVLIWPGTNPIQKLTSQQYAFEIANGLDTVVAVEVVIQDWTTLTRDARAYIDEFAANEILREAEFDNNEFDRNVAFAAGQTGRTDAFNTDQTTRAQAFSDAQTARQNAYAAAESARDSDFDEAETLRQAGYDADHSRAGTDHTQALANNATVAGFNNRVIALESKAVKQYGIRRTLNASSTLLERLNDGIGLVANVPTDDGAAQNDFDAVYPFSQIKECIIDATGRVHYKGDPTYAAAIGDWMVEVPLYYVKDVRTETTQDEYFSAFKLDGYRIPKDFIREDGTVCQKIYYGRFKTGKDGTADVSRPGLVPSNYRDLASFRTGARAKGAGWQEIGINYVKDFLHKLYKIEFANLNSQTVFGPGITSVRYTSIDTAVLAETAVNRFVTTTAIAANFNVGNVVNIGTSLGGNNVASMRVITAINALDASNSEIVFDGAAVNIAIGNIIVMVAQKTGQTINLQKPSGKLSGISGRTSFKWRGIEDPFGNLYEWVDGVLINDNKGYICNKPSLFASSLTADYKPLSYTNANTNGYPFEMGYDENYPEAQFPIAVGAGSSTGYADYYYQNTGLRGALFGGSASFGAVAGLSFWDLDYSPSFAYWFLGGRLLFKPPAV